MPLPWAHEVDLEPPFADDASQRLRDGFRTTRVHEQQRALEEAVAVQARREGEVAFEHRAAGAELIEELLGLHAQRPSGDCCSETSAPSIEVEAPPIRFSTWIEIALARKTMAT